MSLLSHTSWPKPRGCFFSYFRLQCGKIKMIRWGSKPNREKKIHPPKIKTTSIWCLSLLIHWSSNKSISFKHIYAKATIKTDITIFLLECLKDLVIQSRDDLSYNHLRNIFIIATTIISYSKISILFFPHLTTLRYSIFSSENEFDHTACLCYIASILQSQWCHYKNLSVVASCGNWGIWGSQCKVWETGRANTIGLMLTSCKTWGSQRGCLVSQYHSSRCAGSCYIVMLGFSAKGSSHFFKVPWERGA